MLSIWWLVAAFFAGACVSAMLFSLMQVAGYLPGTKD